MKVQGQSKQIIESQMSRLDENEQVLREKNETRPQTGIEREKWNRTIAAERRHLWQQENENRQLYNEKRDQAIEEKKRIERQLGCVNQHLEESERVIAQFQRQISELGQVGLATPRSKEQSSGRASIKLTWRIGKKAPYRMCYSHCSAVDSNMLYVKVGAKLVYALIFNTSIWSQLPDCPFLFDCPLVIISSLLTLIYWWWYKWRPTYNQYQQQAVQSRRWGQC